jgi:hypothetical protein
MPARGPGLLLVCTRVAAYGWGDGCSSIWKWILRRSGRDTCVTGDADGISTLFVSCKCGDERKPTEALALAPLWEGDGRTIACTLVVAREEVV